MKIKLSCVVLFRMQLKPLLVIGLSSYIRKVANTNKNKTLETNNLSFQHKELENNKR